MINMLMASKTNNPKQKNTVLQRVILLMVAVMSAVLMPLASVHADSYDTQIRALQNEVAQYQAQIAQFRAQADTLQNQLNALQAEKNALQTQINLNTAKLNKLKNQIIETEAKIAQQQGVLSRNLVNIYLDSTVTPLEMALSSNSISDYIDKQEYRDTVRQQLQDSIKKVKDLKTELGKQKVAVEETLADQTAQRDALAAKVKEQADLLAQTQGQETAYTQLAAARNARIRELRAQQVLANLKWGGNVSYQPRGGGYPSYWNDIPMDSTLDNWGMFNRECVSYAAFKVAASGRHMPYWGGPDGAGHGGNARLWINNAQDGWRNGGKSIPVDRSPRAGDIAIWPVGYYGHAMYVEAVNNGDLLISEYNYDWSGRFSQRAVSRSTWQAQDFQFIHFE
jgi:peptidoglycan hydrolase CwlO-like protein